MRNKWFQLLCGMGPPKRTSVIGHRGMGASFNQFAFFPENTIESFNKAKELHKADYVEFDVHLTADLIPVVFHDFYVCVPVAPTDSSGKGLKFEKRPISRFTLEQLCCLELHHQSILTATDDKKPDGSRVKRNPNALTTTSFPTLQEVFQHTDPSLAFDIEIKFPSKLKCGEWECDEYPVSPANYIAQILQVVTANHNNRTVMFSSFHPDICIHLKEQQSRFDVVFLTQGLTQIYPPFEDPRAVGSEAAIRFAAAQSFAGVAFHSEELEKRWETLVAMAQTHKLKIYVWGRSLNSPEAVTFFQEKVHSDGLCYDISVVFRAEMEKCLTDTIST